MMGTVQRTPPDAWLGTAIQLAIHELAVVNGYADSLSVRLARRQANPGHARPYRPLAVASIAIASRGVTLLFRPLAVMEPNAFTAIIVARRTGRIVWQEDTDHPSYYEAYDLARRAFARLRRLEREPGEEPARTVP
ncbi:hypothetical protein [Bifidobacterium dentium]|uniref:hypothetical protein n=1 Tax=Bifidobacterium dentium TaxID=1689 RepID=UPI001F504547|nr:hypothetical protein [Bifidobacterium dentium]